MEFNEKSSKVAKCFEPRAAVRARNSKQPSNKIAILVKATDKPIAYLDIDDTGLVDAGYGPVTP